MLADRRRIARWLLTAFVLASAVGLVRSLLEGERAVLLWFAAFATGALLLSTWVLRVRARSLARGVSILLAGPVTTLGVVALLRALPEAEWYTPLSVVEELAYSPVFYLPLAFAISWTVLVAIARAGGPRGRDGCWSSPPFLVWALFASRHLHFYIFSGSVDFDLPLKVRWEIVSTGGWVAALALLATFVASLPVLAERGSRGTQLRIDLLAVIAVSTVVAEWGLTITLLWRIWLL